MSAPYALFDIRLERDFVVFWGNQYESSDQIVKGVVVLCLQSPLKLEDVRVRLDGTVRHSWLTDPGVAQNTNIFKYKWPSLVGARGKGMNLPPGNYEWPFELVLPGDTPESLEGIPDAGITYTLRATINRGKLARHISCVKRLRIIRTLAPTALEFMHSVSVEQTWVNKVDYSISIPNKAVTFGGSVPLEIRLTPLAKGIDLQRIVVKLVEFHEFSMHSRHYVYTREHKSQREVNHWDIDVSTEQYWHDNIEETNQEGWVIKQALELPKTLAECSQDIDAHGIKIYHKLKLHIPIRNQDGHVSHLDMGIPIYIFISPLVNLDNQGNMTSQSPSTVNQESDFVGPPLYGDHVLDQLYSTLETLQGPVQNTQPDSIDIGTAQNRTRLEPGRINNSQASPSRSSSESVSTDSDELLELSRVPTYRTALRAPSQCHNQPPGYEDTT
ncbi:uncharacterized protein FIESC28_10987 [Fusarium coffeatum]|uniref:Arrestin C-terminal-like domain-containing protein n=1 Tax=Fusarium coffeatum TaxID=231269 RepID=A0A366QPC5_9HYPO|nr:uncharacterized protein FIESC28_10987 [Fusarium coffeatum]RBR06592.1 hypothetical protein FIESC28_10987 [Fusarium coffeatum]